MIASLREGGGTERSGVTEGACVNKAAFCTNRGFVFPYKIPYSNRLFSILRGLPHPTPSGAPSRREPSRRREREGSPNRACEVWGFRASPSPTSATQFTP